MIQAVRGRAMILGIGLISTLAVGCASGVVDGTAGTELANSPPANQSFDPIWAAIGLVTCGGVADYLYDLYGTQLTWGDEESFNDPSWDAQTTYHYDANGNVVPYASEIVVGNDLQGSTSSEELTVLAVLLYHEYGHAYYAAHDDANHQNGFDSGCVEGTFKRMRA